MIDDDTAAAPPARIAVRLVPGDDLRLRLEALVRERGWRGAFVIAGIGSLGPTVLRMAGADAARQWPGPVEILSLQGTLSPDGAHLHIAIADALGTVSGGHVCVGCVVRTTAELLVEVLPQHLARVADPRTGYPELAIKEPPGIG